MAALLATASVLPAVIATGGAAFQDMGEWLYEARVLQYLMVTGDTSTFYLRDYPVPYVIPHLLLAALMLVMSPTAAGITAVAVQLLAGCAVVAALVRRFDLHPIAGSVLLTVPIVLTSAFWNGYSGHQIGLIILGAYIALPVRVRTRVWVVLVFSLLTFFTHGMIFGCFGVIAGVYGVYARRLHQVALGSAPSLGLAAWYVLANTEQTGGGELQLGGAVQFIAYKAYSLAKIGGYQNLVVNGVADGQALMLAGALANVLFVIVLAGLVVLRLTRLVRERSAPSAEMTAGLVLLAIAMVLPPALVEIVNPGERLLTPAAVLLVTATASGLTQRQGSVLGSIAAIGVILTAVGACLLPAKADQGDPTPRDPLVTNSAEAGERTGLLFSHRLDQFETRADLAERSWRHNEPPTEPLAFKTTMLDGRIAR
ncbi:hypothetical protein [Janibacter sp. GXQ6167]|uniref:hypothetical protein n=1 Tax=Janibacter sp. GXQ6167 TaxID=3240791 RepID=UPI003524DCBA